VVIKEEEDSNKKEKDQKEKYENSEAEATKAENDAMKADAEQAAQEEEQQMSLDEKQAAVSAEKNKQEGLVSDLKEDDKDEHHDEKVAAAAKAKVAKSKQVLQEAEDKLETASKAEEKLASKSLTSDIPVNKALEQTKQELSKQRSTVQLKQSAIKQQTDELATLESELGQERGEVTRLGEAHSEALHDNLVPFLSLHNNEVLPIRTALAQGGRTYSPLDVLYCFDNFLLHRASTEAFTACCPAPHREHSANFLTAADLLRRTHLEAAQSIDAEA